jgi:putative PEP-CTERM system TPR-repeat lipoprotein
VRTGQWQAAQRWASRFRERFGDDAEIAALEGDVLLGAGMPLQAKQAFEAALTIDPTHEGASLGLAELALRNGQLASAAGRLRAFADREPDRLDALLALATIAERAGQADEALTAWRRAVEIHPGAIEPRMALARLLRERGDADRAVSALRDNAPGAFRRDADYLRALAETAFDAGMAELAAEAARDLVVLRPNALSAYRLYAAILAALGDKAALEETLEQILVRVPADVSTRLELARVYVASGRLPLAERLLDPLLTEPNRPAPVDFLYGLILAGTDRPTQAIEKLEGAHRAMASRRTLLALADATAQIGQVDEAISRVATWLETFPNDVMVRLSLAGYLVRAERVSEAVAEYERVVAQEPDHAIALNNLAWYTLASDAVSAIDYARRAMDLSPDSLEIAHTLISAQTAVEEWREAELTLDRVLPMHPNDSALLWLSARVLYQRGKPRDARARLERLLRQTPSDAERDRASELLERLNREILASELQ